MIDIMKEVKKAIYVTPSTRVCFVEMEDGLCAGSPDIQNPTGSNGQIEAHGINNDFQGSFGADTWDSVVTAQN